jgi:hypothetical protein
MTSWWVVNDNKYGIATRENTALKMEALTLSATNYKQHDQQASTGELSITMHSHFHLPTPGHGLSACCCEAQDTSTKQLPAESTL